MSLKICLGSAEVWMRLEISFYCKLHISVKWDKIRNMKTSSEQWRTVEGASWFGAAQSDIVEGKWIPKFIKEEIVAATGRSASY